MSRILVLTSTFPRFENDVEPRFVLDLCRYLSRHAEVCVVAPHAPGAALRETIDGVAVWRFRYFVPAWQALTYRGGINARVREKPWRAVQLPFLLLGLYRAASRAIRVWQPDLIHAHWIIPQGVVACLVSRGRIPVICTSHGGDLFGLQGAFSQSIKRWALRRCQSVTVVSESMVEPVLRLAPNAEVSVIPMGTDVSGLFTPPGNPEERRDNEILFVGRLVQKKGLRHLVDAFARIRRRNPDASLTIVGDGPLRPRLQQQVSMLDLGRNVCFVGGVPHGKLPEFYRRAAVAVFPFVVDEGGDQEGFGLVITEAMGCGCPVIASDLPAIRHSIKPGVTGILTPPGDSDALANAIFDCLSDTERQASIAAMALQYVRSKYDWPQVAHHYLKVIQASMPSRWTESSLR